MYYDRGKIIAAASEERFTRIKMDSAFPEKSISFCLEFAGLKLSEIDIIAYSWTKGFKKELLQNYVERSRVSL